jgi:hypothetical protein
VVYIWTTAAFTAGRGDCGGDDKVVEEGLASQMLAAPQSAYTRALFAAAFEHDVRPIDRDA